MCRNSFLLLELATVVLHSGDTSPQDGYGHAPSRWSKKGKRVTRCGP